MSVHRCVSIYFKRFFSVCFNTILIIFSWKHYNIFGIYELKLEWYYSTICWQANLLLMLSVVGIYVFVRPVLGNMMNWVYRKCRVRYSMLTPTNKQIPNILMANLINFEFLGTVGLYKKGKKSQHLFFFFIIMRLHTDYRVQIFKTWFAIKNGRTWSIGRYKYAVSYTV